MKYWKIYKLMLKQSLKNQLEYRADLIIGIISFVVMQAIGLFSISLMYNYIPDLVGWTYPEVLLIYGLFQIPRGIDHLLTDNIWLIPQNVIKGQFDKYLIKPVQSLFYIVAERFQLEALGEIIVGIGILSYAFPKLNIDFNFINILGLIYLIITGTIIYTSIKLLSASTAFWLKNSFPVMVTVYEMSNFVQRPLNIYPKSLRLILTYVIPFAFTAYYPATYLLNKNVTNLIFVQASLVSLVFVIISITVWNTGLKMYESAGS